MTDWRLPDGYRNQVELANHVPGPLHPPDYYYVPRILECGDSEEDCDGIECGRGPIRPEPEDYKYWMGES